MVISKLVRWKKKKNIESPRLPDGVRVYAVGDIHGRLDLFDHLIATIDQDDSGRGDAERWLILLGDLMDRGPDSAGVIERALALRNSRVAAGWRVRCLAGNHEEVFLRAARGDVKAMRFLIRIGGRATVQSYGFSDEEYQAMDFDALTEAFVARVPRAHIDFLESFEDKIALGDYLFVHAGIRPGVPIDAQKPSDLRWIREEFLNDKADHGVVVIHGHTITDVVDVRDNRIGIDTGAFASGVLTAIGLEGRERWFLQASEAEIGRPAAA